MLWLPFRRALRNPIFGGGVEEFAQQHARRSQLLNYLIVLSIVLFITWPKEGFLSLRDLPFTYNAVGGTIIIILAYLHLSQGSRKTLGSRYLSVQDWLLLAPLEAQTFLRGYVAVGLLEVGLFWGVSLPLLVLAAGVSGESLAHLGAGGLIVLVCVSSYRIMGVALLMFLERDEFLLYIVVRILYVFIILVSGFVVPLGNPVLAFADASVWPRHVGVLAVGGLTLHGWVATVVLHLLLGGLFFIIASVRVRWVRRRATVPMVAEGEVEHGNV
jgi:hypothetical protein